jgi:hypothetical protein
MQRPDSNSSRFDNHKVPRKFVGVHGNDFGNGRSFRGVRKSIQLQQHDAAHAEMLANDHLSKISILGDQYPTFGTSRAKDILVRGAGPRFSDRNHLMTAVSKPFDDHARDVFIGEKTHQPAGRTVSCCI